MKHEIDLKKYNIHTDLIDYYTKNTDIVEDKETINNNKISRYFIDSKDSLRIGRKKGNYTTISFDDITDSTNFNNTYLTLLNELNLIFEKNNINDNMSCLIIGLGNIDSTADSLGPLTAKKILVTNPIYELGSLDDGFRRTYVVSPNVYANTGIETKDYIKSIIKQINVDFILVIDALASESIDRINKTIQLTDTGISPGSGVGNNRGEISYEELNIPVIAIGIPTVVDASTIVSDTINYLYKNYAYNKKNLNNAKNKLILYNNIEYNNNDEIKKDEKEKIFGVIGGLENAEIKQLIYEVLSPVGLNMMVTPKEVDFLIKKETEILSKAINKVLHKKFI